MIENQIKAKTVNIHYNNIKMNKKEKSLRNSNNNDV